MGAGCSTASVFIQMDEIVAIARSNRIEEALLKEEVVVNICDYSLIGEKLYLRHWKGLVPIVLSTIL